MKKKGKEAKFPKKQNSRRRTQKSVPSPSQLLPLLLTLLVDSAEDFALLPAAAQSNFLVFDYGSWRREK
jgi:hypothetical protein